MSLWLCFLALLTFRSFGNTTITIIVGPEDDSTSFSVHESLVRQESGFVEAIFRNGWKENEKRIVRLPEHDAEHFKIFFNFIYTGFIFSSKPGDAFADKPEKDAEWTRLAYAYALGNYLQASDFKDAMMDAMIDKVKKSKQCSHQTMYQIIYPNSVPGSGVRKLLVDVAATRWTWEFLKQQHSAPEWSDFFLDLSIAHHEIRAFPSRKTIVWDNVDTCQYHGHQNSPQFEFNRMRCYKQKRRFGG